MVEAENLTDHKMLRVRVDHGCKWDNQLWISFKNKKGFIPEYTIVYAYQQNRAAEQSMYIILDIAWSMLVDSDLPTKY